MKESCIINGGNTTRYFKIQKGAWQGDPVSANLFILCLETVFILIKANKIVKGINIFEHAYLNSAYADDTTFSLRDKRSVKELVNTFATFRFETKSWKMWNCKYRSAGKCESSLWHEVYWFV